MKPILNQKKHFLNYLLTGILIACSSWALSQPMASFSVNQVSGCSPILVNFSDQSTGNPTEWKWDLGNGTFSNLQNPSATYFTPGFYTIKLFVKAGNNQDSAVKINLIHVFEQPVVKFSTVNNSGCSPFTAVFLDESSGNSSNTDTRLWDFGDGVLSSEERPSHTYTYIGNYNVTLKVSNNSGCIATLTKTDYIKNNGTKAGFINNVFATCIPNKIVFQNKVVNNGTFTSQWDFGDSTSSTLDNPTHTYALGGNYTVKQFIRSQYGCLDSVVKNLKVINPISAFFSADVLKGCRPPLKATFTNQVLSGNNYLWTFGDSTISSAANPVHQYSDTGNFTVKLIVRNSSGCVDSLKRIGYIKIHKPFLYFNNLPDSGCLGFTKSLTAISNSVDAVTGYNWNFGDGTTSSEVSPTHTFSNSGYYNISLIGTTATGCSDTAILPKAIKVNTLPHASFSVSVNISCASTPITFTNLSTGGATTWTWDFGDNTLGYEFQPIHIYKDTGWMAVQLIAMNGGCADTARYVKYIYIQPVVTRFNFNMNCATPLVRFFKNYSLGATSCLWDFGDGTTSTEKDPVHTFPGQGMYTVKLKAWNDSTGCEYSLIKSVRVLNIKAVFVASDTVVCKGSIINFTTGLNNLDVARFYWSYGDGVSNNTRNNNTAYAYPASGDYTVRLITLDYLNCRDTLVKTRYINVNGPKALFGSATPITCINYATVFSDSSLPTVAQPIKSWIWNYGDGKTDTVAAPPFQHTYAKEGSYVVSLKLIDSKGCTDTFKIAKSVQINRVIARFYVQDTIACPDFPVRFILPYSTPGISYRWDFGDGTTSSLQFPNHSYSKEGIYTVKVKVVDKYGCEDSSIMVNVVRIVKTVARFAMSDSFKTCPPLLIQFTNQSINSVDEFWDFGDSSATDVHNPSHFYTYPGVYTITLFAKGPGGCVNKTQKQIVVKGPQGYIKYVPLSLCKPYQVNFVAHSTNAVSYIWDFNDGVTINSTDTNIIHIYKDSGQFIPKIILVDDIGCKVPVTGKDTLTNIFANAAFNFTDKVICDQGSISFINTTVSNDLLVNYKWDFGDNSSAAEQNPVHKYISTGIYYPSLSVTTINGCKANYKSPVPVKVVQSPGINILSSGNGCVPLTTSLKVIQSNADTSVLQWKWIMGDNSIVEMQNPPQQFYNTAGIYTLNLTATSTTGCSKTITHVIEAYALPAIQVTKDSFICKGQNIKLQANGAVSYNWSPSIGLSSTNIATPIASPLTSTQYIVTGTSPKGCISKQTVSVNVKQPFAMTYSRPAILCAGQGKRIEANGAGTYQWSPAKGLSNTTAAAPTAQPDTTTNYRVIGTDDKGCFKDTGFIKLTVYPIPLVNAGEDKTINVGRPVDLDAIVSDDVTTVNWTPTGDIFRNSRDGITVKPTQNTEYTVEVKNAGGCAARDRVNVFVICNGNNIFVPNLFSPNDDGVNDIFYPRGTGVFKIKTIRIFNRWGEAVFEKSSFNSNDATAGWDGKYKGNKLNADVYVYIMEFICDNNSILSFKGNVTLVR